MAGAGAFSQSGPGQCAVERPCQATACALADLAATVSAAARRGGATPPDADRGFTPHLTLARCRAPVDVREIVDRLDGYQGPGWTVQEIYLIRSTPDGQPRYETLETWKLRPVTS